MPQTARPATTTSSNSQPDPNLVIALSLQPDLVSGIGYPLNLKPSLTLVSLGASLNLFFIFVSIPLVHTNIVLGHRSIVGGNIDSVLLLYITCRASFTEFVVRRSDHILNVVFCTSCIVQKLSKLFDFSFVRLHTLLII